MQLLYTKITVVSSHCSKYKIVLFQMLLNYVEGDWEEEGRAEEKKMLRLLNAVQVH